MALPLSDAFTARALGTLVDDYEQSLGVAPYLGRSFFGTDKKRGLTLKFIKGRKGLPVALKASAFDAQAPLRHPIGLSTIENEMPFFRESYMVTEKEEQDYDTFRDANNDELANQVLKEIVKNPLDLVMGADVVPERMIWQLMAPEDGVPKIDVVVDGGKRYTIDYTGDNGAEYKKTNYMALSGTSLWSASASATPIKDLVQMQKRAKKRGRRLTTFVMNENTWEMFCNAEDTHKQVQGILAYQNGIMLDEADVKRFLSGNYGITILVYEKLYLDENGKSQSFIPDGVVTAIDGGTNLLGTVTYGTTPEERSGSETDGSLSIVKTGVAIYTYQTNHPINTHCIVSEIVLPTYENMDSVFILKTV